VAAGAAVQKLSLQKKYVHRLIIVCVLFYFATIEYSIRGNNKLFRIYSNKLYTLYNNIVIASTKLLRFGGGGGHVP